VNSGPIRGSVIEEGKTRLWSALGEGEEVALLPARGLRHDIRDAKSCAAERDVRRKMNAKT